ncbi:MAG: CoA transferase [Rhodospirillaceae bacterium]|nr:CoA transferase [Rhodospirillaceae bacterium]
MSQQAASSALDQYLVLDLTRARAGPTAARQLADFGARVIKIEMPGDPMYGDMGTRHGPDFQNLHRNKESMTLNLKEARGKEIFLELVKKADVVVENYRPPVKFNLGIDYETLKKINPRIVYASISGFGQDGPYANRPGLDQVAQGMGGHMSVTGEPGGGPVRSGAAISDMTAGLLAAGGIFAALLEREKSGEGQWLHTSLLEAQIFLLDFQAARWLIDKEVPGQVGNNHPTNVPMGTFPTKDGYMNAAPTAAMWDKFCAAMDLGPLEHDPDYATPHARRDNRVRLNEIITEKTIQKSTNQWIALLNDARVPCGPINKMDEVFADEQVKHLNVAQVMHSPVRGDVEIVGQPVHLTRTPSRIAEPTPEMGQHTQNILEEIGLSEDEIEQLKTTGVV